MPPKQESSDVEDIFAETDDSVVPGRAQKSSRQKTPLEVSARASQPSPQSGQPQPTSTKHASWTLKRTLLLVVVPFVVVAVAGAVIAIGPFGFGADDTASSDTANQTAATNQQTTTNDDTSQPLTSFDIPSANAQIIDEDGDGLSDDREAELGTDRSDPDTDGDGLFDPDEVNVYQTNPRNPDTDGDGNNDGVEVQNGYNPKGEGLLRDLNVAIQELQNS